MGARHGAVLAAAALLLQGCASAALHSYLGHSVDEISSRYGPPAAQSNLPDGTKEFEWVIAARHRPETAVPLSTFLPLDEAPLNKRRAASSAGLLLGGMCVYSVQAQRDERARMWRVINYRTPRIDCN